MLLLPLLLAIEFGESDADLVGRLQRRDPRAMADLYDRYGRLVYARGFGYANVAKRGLTIYSNAPKPANVFANSLANSRLRLASSEFAFLWHERCLRTLSNGDG